MPLTHAQLQGITAISGGDDERDHVDLYIPTGYMGPVNAGVLAETVSRACWNWALCGSAQNNPEAPSSPVTLYSENGPVNPLTNRPRLDFPHRFPEEPNIGALWRQARDASAPAAAARERAANARADAAAAVRTASATAAVAERRRDEAIAAAEIASAAEYADATRAGDHDPRKLFMAAMAREAARRNGLRPQTHASPYKIHVTAPLADWYHWQHWALSISDGNRTRFIQTEPNVPIKWGHTRIWEANRPRHIEASFYVADLLPEHIHVIDCFLRMPRCSGCNRVKPNTATTFNTRWHQCTAAIPHYYCPQCGARLGWNGKYVGAFRRTRTCGSRGCNHETTLF